MSTKLSRRDFLKMLAVLGVGIKLAPRSNTIAQDEKIIVVGAGASGLIAAYWLMDAGYDVTVLEARDRIGGRTWSDYSLAPYPIEFGAEFIHGDEAITWDVLEEVGEESLDNASGDTRIYYDASLQSPIELAFTLGMLQDPEELFGNAVFEWLNENDGDISVSGLLDLMAADDPSRFTPEFRKFIINLITNQFAGSADEIGIAGLARAYETETDGDGDFRVENGYSSIWDAVADGLDIRLNTPIAAIDWSGDSNVVTATDGTTFEADRVVITLPLGVLKSGNVAFTPQLPSEKQIAISSLGAGAVDKIILKFDEAFWEEQVAFFVTTQNSRFWWRPGFERGENEVPILTAFFSGEAAAFFETLSEDDAIQAALNDLKIMFGRDDLGDYLVEAHFIAWGTDPYSLMGYSYVPVGGLGQREILAEPIDDVLFFAGEATHTEKSSTVHGAIETGIRVAEEIMNL